MVPSSHEYVERFLKQWKYIGWPLEHLALTWLFMIGRPKCQVSFILFQIWMSPLCLFQISFSFLMFLLFVVDARWTSYGPRVPNLWKFSIQVISQTSSSIGYKRSWSVFEEIHTKKYNRLKIFNLKFELIINYILRIHKFIYN